MPTSSLCTMFCYWRDDEGIVPYKIFFIHTQKIPYAIFRWHRGFFGLCYSLGGVQSPPPEPPPPEPPEPEEPPLLLGMGVVRAVEAAI